MHTFTLFVNFILILLVASGHCQTEDSIITTKTATKVQKIIHIWTIDNFTFYINDIVYSPQLPATGTTFKGLKWHLAVKKIKRDYVEPESTVIMWRSNRPDLVEVSARFIVTIVDRDDQPITTIASNAAADTYKDNEYHSSWLTLGTTNTVLNQYLTDGNLRLIVEIQMLFDELVLSENGSPFKFNIPKCALEGNMGNYLINEMQFRDVNIYVKGQMFSAHRIILSARSTYFANLLSTRASTFNTSVKSDIIYINNTDAPIFQRVLQFIYTDKVEPFLNMEVEMLQSAVDFHLTRLQVACESQISRSVTIVNAVPMYALAKRFNLDQLKEYILVYVKKQAARMDKKSWTNLLAELSKLIDK